ncbi:hypothetical protein [Vibrio sp. D431a]|uniref:hypothetical protein n=1 Tax=Vibrio sp. D431a TaxID=2837388 RepID=UPI0025548FCA|nr:hypothetical protein [Vibrio sp. D431a]MDK9790697.1 hypothetical protein [Vibrio sp. D431a]
MKKLLLGVVMLSPLAQASPTPSPFDSTHNTEFSDSLFKGDYKALSLCKVLSAERHKEKFLQISKSLASIDPYYFDNLANFDLRGRQFSQLEESDLDEFRLLCNKFADASEHMTNEDLAKNMFTSKQFLVSTSFALLIQELKLQNRLGEARSTIDTFADFDIPHAKIMKAGFLLEDGKIEEATELAKNVASDGLAIAHITLSAIYDEQGLKDKAYAWLYVGLNGVVRAHSKLFDRLAELDSQLSEEERIHAMLLKDEIEKKYPVKKIVH